MSMNTQVYLVFAGADYYPPQAPDALKGVRHTAAEAWSLAWSHRQEDWVRIIALDTTTLTVEDVLTQAGKRGPDA
jgi:hypothetical protein